MACAERCCAERSWVLLACVTISPAADEGCASGYTLGEVDPSGRKYVKPIECCRSQPPGRDRHGRWPEKTDGQSRLDGAGGVGRHRRAGSLTSVAVTRQRVQRPVDPTAAARGRARRARRRRPLPAPADLQHGWATGGPPGCWPAPRARRERRCRSGPDDLGAACGEPCPPEPATRSRAPATAAVAPPDMAAGAPPGMAMAAGAPAAPSGAAPGLPGASVAAIAGGAAAPAARGLAPGRASGRTT